LLLDKYRRIIPAKGFLEEIICNKSYTPNKLQGSGENTRDIDKEGFKKNSITKLKIKRFINLITE